MFRHGREQPDPRHRQPDGAPVCGIGYIRRRPPHLERLALGSTSLDKTMRRINPLYFALLFLAFFAISCTATTVPSQKAEATLVTLETLAETQTPTSTLTPAIPVMELPNSTQTIIPIPIPSATNQINIREKLLSGMYLIYWVDYDYEIHVMPFQDLRRPVVMFENVLPMGFDISPNGDYYLYSDLDKGIVLYNVSSEALEPFFYAESSLPHFNSPMWSKNGDKIVFVATDFLYDESIFVRDVTTGKSKLLTPWRGTKSQPCWSPDDKWIAFISDQIKFDNEYFPRHSIYLLDSQCFNNLDGCQDSLISLIPFFENNIESLSWSPQGELTFVTTIEGQYGIFSSLPDGDKLSLLFAGNPSFRIGPLVWSENGDYLAFTQITPSIDVNLPNNADIYVLDIMTGEVINITNTPSGSEIVNSWLNVK
ncbi:MAG: hypothetical protein CVU44_16800 [Chloroflexi bacterium HGW-Chloroflexi-6]|nr:MAG: hypothetical protein CVU44_16800 [Chloroflexi bacterium HGW-Chloroflexi-6]